MYVQQQWASRYHTGKNGNRYTRHYSRSLLSNGMSLISEYRIWVDEQYLQRQYSLDIYFRSFSLCVFFKYTLIIGGMVHIVYQYRPRFLRPSALLRRCQKLRGVGQVNENRWIDGGEKGVGVGYWLVVKQHCFAW